MEGIGAISSIKSTVELCHSSLSSNSEYLNEVAEAVHQGSTGIKDKLDSIGQDLATAKTNRESINLSRTQLSSISALLTENLKVVTKTHWTLNIFPYVVPLSYKTYRYKFKLPTHGII